jgi:hypothetical protein
MRDAAELDTVQFEFKTVCVYLCVRTHLCIQRQRRGGEGGEEAEARGWP